MLQFDIIWKGGEEFGWVSWDSSSILVAGMVSCEVNRLKYFIELPILLSLFKFSSGRVLLMAEPTVKEGHCIKLSTEYHYLSKNS